MDKGLVKFETIDEKIGIITLNRLDKMNALSDELMQELRTTTERVNADDSLRVVILRGGDKTFASGIDIKPLETMTAETAENQAFINDSWFAVERIKVPTIASVSGYALGGGFELALMCDILIADLTARFGFPEITLGLMPGMGGTLKLQRLMNPKIAFQKIILGEIFDAVEALSLGIINEIAMPTSFDAAISLAQKISKMPKESLIHIKQSFTQCNPREKEMQLERELFRALFSSKGKIEGIRAFLDKKPLIFD